MTYTPHFKVKPQVIVDGAVAALEDKLAVSQTVTRLADIKKFNYQPEDTVTMRVPGTLPVRTYAPRNDRSLPIVTDTYSEQTVSAKITRDRPYSAIRITDEQADWDFEGWANLFDVQTNALAQWLEAVILRQITEAKYEVVQAIDTSKVADAIAKNQDVFYNAFVDAAAALRRMRNPGTSLTAIVGINIASEIRKSNKLVLETGNGSNALAGVNFGTLAGVSLIESTQIDPNTYYIYDKSAFVNYNGVPRVPNSVPFGATASAGGFALRHLIDYDTAYMEDRSVFDCYTAYGTTLDTLRVADTSGILHDSPEQYFVRGIKGVLVTKAADATAAIRVPGDGKQDTAGSKADSWLAKVWNLDKVAAPEVGAGTPWPLAGNFPASKTDAPTPPAGDGK